MKIHLFFLILLFWVTISPARKRYPQYGSVDMRKDCRKSNGRCKVECHEYEIRIGPCIRPGSHCCFQN
ncbi:PREDICTED: beta-defensin 110-like [Miniopterus natalensis]|uniref:beta-defensin 110-like n=1 Tax=Miniopterus natalensis TaxID=291302 RepID=UPI0007A6E423|nr:PREDICTED: beta-defensin 110-like [Miniopterus natalensis]